VTTALSRAAGRSAHLGYPVCLSWTPPVIRLRNGGRLDFWSLENSIVGRGRGYQRVVIDEAAFTKDGDNRSEDSMMAHWEKGIKPTLFDYGGEALVCSNSAGRNADNFFYNICTDPQYGFHEFHATTLDNPLLPKRASNESVQAWLARQARFHEDLRKDNDPLVFAQEYLAEFVDWSGVAFFSREKLLVGGQPLPLRTRCDTVFAVIDTASKTGTDNDATAVTFLAVDRAGKIPLLILDWDILQIEGALLETWLPEVFATLEELARQCGARHGSIGAFIEDQNSGTILLQQALRRQMPVRAIDSKLTAMGKDERAISVSGYVHRQLVKYTVRAFEKTVVYKRHSRNHLDTFWYGIALALGNSEGFQLARARARAPTGLHSTPQAPRGPSAPTPKAPTGLGLGI
jgi:phage terminase large subunit-like protein